MICGDACMYQKMWFVETAGSEQTSSAIMLWAKTRVYVCSGRAGGNERHLLFYARYEETWPPTPPPTPSVHDTNSTSTYSCVEWNMYVQLRSIQHVCQYNACNYVTCVASTMCASARNVIIPTPPQPSPHPMLGVVRERARPHARFSTRWQKFPVAIL